MDIRTSWDALYKEGGLGLTWVPVMIKGSILLMDKILHDLKDPKLWESWYIP